MDEAAPTPDRAAPARPVTSANPTKNTQVPTLPPDNMAARARARAQAKAKAQAAGVRAGQKARPPRTPLQMIGMVAAVLGFLAPLVLPLGLDPLPARMLSIFLAAIALWITEAIPLVATATLVIFGEVMMVSTDALFLDPEILAAAPKATLFFNSLANPVIILFLGGFLIADGAEKYGLDKALAATLLRPFLGSPRLTLLGIMAITAVMSMFMSNTATTATMFAVMMPVLAGLPPGKARAGVALSIPVAANVGGMGTPVGTPPNAIALAVIQSHGIHISFGMWMAMAMPLMLVVLAISWAWIAFRYLPSDVTFNINLDARFNTSRQAVIYYVVAGTTVLLWMTESLHGVSSNNIGFLPVVILLSLKVMTGEDIRKLDWPVLWLVAGGIALGAGVGATKLDVVLIGSVPWTTLPLPLLLAAMAGLGLAMSNVISHSASANLLVPLGLGLAATLGPLDGAGKGVAVAIAAILALGCSLGMCMPISTPPNAIAYSTGEVTTGRMAVTGLVVGISGALLLALTCPTYWAWLGIG